MGPITFSSARAARRNTSSRSATSALSRSARARAGPGRAPPPASSRSLEDLDGMVVRSQVVVHADEDAPAGLHVVLELLRGAGDLPLEPADLRSRHHPSPR